MRPHQQRNIEDMEYPVWDQQKDLGEKDGPYMMFLLYAGMKPSERTVRRAWEKWIADTTREEKNPPPSGTFTSISKSFCWEERAAQRDLQMLRDTYSKWVDRSQLIREEDWKAGKSIREKAYIALDRMANKPENLDLGLSEIASLFKMASQLQTGALPAIINNMGSGQIRELMKSLPNEKRTEVLRIVELRRTIEGSNGGDEENETTDAIEGSYKALPPTSRSAAPRALNLPSERKEVVERIKPPKEEPPPPPPSMDVSERFNKQFIDRARQAARQQE